MNHTWAVVLAGGDGRRLESLTTGVGGITVPKQYCSLQGGVSLLQSALARARAVVPTARLCTVVAAQHRMWRFAQLRSLLDDNVIEQPRNRGTAHGVLLPLLHILERDPAATVLLLPADHHVQDEAVFADALRRTIACACADPGGVFLLGAEPDAPETELGYLVPDQEDARQPARLVEFVEKPSADRARDLVERGALWNTFIIAASAHALLALYGPEFASTILHMKRTIDRRGGPQVRQEFTEWYETLPTRDFSRDVLEGQEAHLKMVRLAPCGWSDLGTPQGVAQTLARLPRSTRPTALISDAALGLDLATQHWQVEYARQSPSNGRAANGRATNGRAANGRATNGPPATN